MHRNQYQTFGLILKGILFNFFLPPRQYDMYTRSTLQLFFYQKLRYGIDHFTSLHPTRKRITSKINLKSENETIIKIKTFGELI